jgi:cellulase (glycosyl hydrolase family 5)
VASIVLLINVIFINGFVIPSRSFGIQDETKISVGVNMHGYYTIMKEFRSTTTPFPANYYKNSFKTLSSAGINTIRYLFSWESYEKNPTLWVQELERVALTADRYGIKVIYDNDIYHTSSWLDPKSGYGFPSFLFENNPEFPYAGGGGTENATARKWWSEWYNRSLAVVGSSDIKNADGWTLQADFLKKVVSVVDGHESTMGYEILNEPPVFSPDQWDKIGKYNTFITNELRTVTQKKIFFDRQLPSDVGGFTDALPQNMAKMAPANKTNVIFKSALYDVPTHCNYAEDRLNTVKKTAQLLGIPLWMGEFNMGTYKERPVAHLNQTGVDLFVQKFRELKLWGWAFWIWSYIRSPPNVDTYNLVNFTKSSSKLQPTIYFDYFKNTITDNITRKFNSQLNSDTNGTTTANNMHHTICPTILITKVNAVKTGMKYTTPTPLALSSKEFAGEFSVEGVAYDSGSNLTKVEVKSDDGQYLQTLPRLQGDWTSWSAKVPVTSNASTSNVHKLFARATDNTGNHKTVSIYIKII